MSKTENYSTKVFHDFGELKKRICDVIPKEKLVYTEEEIEQLHEQIRDILNEPRHSALILKSIDHSSPVHYKGRSFEITNPDGLGRKTKVFLNGEEIHYLKEITLHAGETGGLTVKLTRLDIL